MHSRLTLAIRQTACWAVVTLCAAGSAHGSTDDPLADWLQGRGLLTAPPTHTPSEPNTATQVLAGLVVHAMAYLDTPYRLGGNSLDEGLDCSGFVQAAYRHSLGIPLPRRAAEQAQATVPIESAALVPGDLVFFNTLGPDYSHVGLYVGQGRFIHAPRAGAQIRMENMHTSYWAQRFNGARRVSSLVAGITPAVTP